MEPVSILFSDFYTWTILTEFPITKSTYRLVGSRCDETGVFRCIRYNDTTASLTLASSSTLSTSIPELYDEEIRKFLALNCSTFSSLEHFHIQGWRRRTKILVRDAGWLHRLARNYKISHKTWWTPKTFFLVLAISLIGPERDQKSFNHKVLL